MAGTFLYCIIAALIPVINAEAYVGGVAATVDHAGVWALAAAAAAGQMVGKSVYYLIGRSSLNWRWVRKRTESERWKASTERWQRRIGGNTWLAGAVLLVSAGVGFPPFGILAVIAGQSRIPPSLFLIVGFTGLFGRFAAILGLAGALFR